MKKYLKLVASIVICQMAGILGAVFTTNSVDTWYSTITRPDIAPPNWIFGPVWTTLFLLMGISLYIVWNKGLQTRESKVAVSVFGFQLVLNTLWSIIFFGLHNPGLAFIEIIFLWISILASIILFYRISKVAAYLLIPYILWVSFAAFLNYNIWILN
jgi:benzodiazapine receptor